MPSYTTHTYYEGISLISMCTSPILSMMNTSAHLPIPGAPWSNGHVLPHGHWAMQDQHGHHQSVLANRFAQSYHGDRACYQTVSSVSGPSQRHVVSTSVNNAAPVITPTQPQPATDSQTFSGPGINPDSLEQPQRNIAPPPNDIIRSGQGSGATPSLRLPPATIHHRTTGQPRGIRRKSSVRNATRQSRIFDIGSSLQSLNIRPE